VKRDEFQGGSDVILDAATQHEQAGVLARVERIGGAGSRTKAESIGLIVISRTVTIE
jgi:hypothetical protein